MEEAFDFYEMQEQGAGEYFATNLLADIERNSTQSSSLTEIGLYFNITGHNTKIECLGIFEGTRLICK